MIVQNTSPIVGERTGIMIRRIIATLLACLLLLGALPALADEIIISDGIDLAGEALPVEPDGGALAVDAPVDFLLANEGEEDPMDDWLAGEDEEGDEEDDEDLPIELSISKSVTRQVTVGFTYQISVPGKTIKSCKSSNKKIATVTNAGLLTPKKAGSAKITVTPKKGSKLTLKLKVLDPTTPTAVAIDQGTSATLSVGMTMQLTATVTPGAAPQSVSWKSSNTGVAAVDSDGLVTALKKGAATITATTGNKLTAKLALTVLKAPPQPYVIAHAMGGIDSNTYTNCLEAFQANYAAGHRIFEIDLHFTSDGKLVLWHSWDYQFCSRHTPGVKPSYKQFMGAKIYDRYTPLDLKKLLKLMAAYPDIRIILDGKYGKLDTAKRQYKQIVSTARDLKLTKVLNRITAEIYNESMYTAVKKIYNFPEYMLALYKMFDSKPTEAAFRSVAEYCGRKGISTIVMDAMWWNPNFVDIAADCGVKLALYTVNDPAQAQDFFDAGVIALFSDFLPPI